MNTKSTDKKSNEDMHQAMIVAKLRMAGKPLSELSRQSGLKPNSLRNVFYRSVPKYEQIIADALGLEPSDIWPSRYSDRNEVA